MVDWLIEAARGKPVEPDLPEGLYMFDGRPHFDCRSCEAPTLWEGELTDFDIDAHENMCGGSPRCCP